MMPKVQQLDARDAVRSVVRSTDGTEIERLELHEGWPPVHPEAIETFAREERAFAAHPFDAEMAAKITVPTLLLTGTRSPDWYPEAPTVATALPDARLVELPGQGHAADIVASDLIADHLLSFMAGDR